jgi:hypothetical protein
MLFANHSFPPPGAKRQKEYSQKVTGFERRNSIGTLRLAMAGTSIIV